MDQVNVTQRMGFLANACDPSKQFAAIGVRAEAVQNLNAGSERNIVTKNPDRRSFLDDPTA
jgi:hypothetical protein